MHVGFGTQQDLLSILRKDCLNQKNVKKIRIDARKFLITLLEKIFDKNAMSFNRVKYVSVLDPKVLASHPLDVSKSLFQSLLFTLAHLEIIYVHHKLI